MIRVYVENSRIPRHDITRRSKFVTTVEYEAGCCRSEDRGQRQGAKAWGRGMGQRPGAECLLDPPRSEALAMEVGKPLRHENCDDPLLDR